MPRYIGNQGPSSETQQVIVDETSGITRAFTAPEISPSNADIAHATGRLALETGSLSETIPGTVSVVGPDGFELTMTDQLYKGIKASGFKEVRDQFARLVEQIMADPFGPTNIDQSKGTDEGQWARLVHEVTGPLAGLLGPTLAIKRTGLNMEATRNQLERGGPHRIALAEQFRITLDAARRQRQIAPEGIGGIVSVNDVFGVVRWRQPDGDWEEWMLMERVEQAKPVENVFNIRSDGGVDVGFDNTEHPGLAQLAQTRQHSYSVDGFTRFNDLARVLGESLGYDPHDGLFNDLKGQNVLYKDTDGVRVYIVIDLQRN